MNEDLQQLQVKCEDLAREADLMAAVLDELDFCFTHYHPHPCPCCAEEELCKRPCSS